LRGKILRIHPEPDGTYSIPPGNLFVGDSLHRPEIYIMGVRNPFRFCIDPITNALYWAEVGPNAPRIPLSTFIDSFTRVGSIFGSRTILI
jgi:cytochrome c